MKGLIDFMKSVVVGGFFVILPLAVVGYFVTAAVVAMLDAIAPLAHRLPFGGVGNTLAAGGAVIGGLLLICFLAGVLVRTRLGASLLDWLEQRLLEKVPFYSTVKHLGRSMTGEAAGRFVPVEADVHGGGARVLGLIVERLPDGRLVVFVPVAPTSMVGQIYLLEPAAVRELNASLVDFAGCIGEWGAGAGKLYPRA